MLVQDSPSKPRAIVHIGPGKTGSTSIQRWLLENRESLADQEVTFDPMEAGRISERRLDHVRGLVVFATWLTGRPAPVTPAFHFRLGKGEKDLDKIQDFQTRLLASIRSHPSGTYVLSCEYIAYSLKTAEEVEVFDRFLKRHFSKVSYVIYIREQASHLLSTYSQLIKQGHDFSVEEFLESSGARNFDAIIGRWLDAVGEGALDVRIFEPESFVGGDLIADFADTIGADPSGTMLPARENPSLDESQLDELRELNRTGGTRLNGRLTHEEIKVRRRIIDRPRTGKLRLTPEQVARVRDRNAASNERLRKRLFPDRETLFAATRQDEPK